MDETLKAAGVRIDSDGVSFLVDGQLPYVEPNYERSSTAELIDTLMHRNGQESEGYLHASFEGEDIVFIGVDAFYRSFFEAYAQHRPLVLSPDMIWLTIIQQLGRHIDNNPEKYRDVIVTHRGKKEIVVDVDYHITDEGERCTAFVEGCIVQIAERCTDIFRPMLNTEFSTTTLAERIATKSAVMGALMPYFTFRRRGCICGIPYITLKGTPDDWLKIISMLDVIELFDLRQWTQSLREILVEFVSAAQGRPNRDFWRRIVMQEMPEEGIQQRVCGSDTLLDGWFLHFFSPETKYAKRINIDHHLKSEMVALEFTSHLVGGPAPIDTPMVIWTGFPGVKIDPVTTSITPRIGWLVRNGRDETTYI